MACIRLWPVLGPLLVELVKGSALSKRKDEEVIGVNLVHGLSSLAIQSSSVEELTFVDYLVKEGGPL